MVASDAPFFFQHVARFQTAEVAWTVDDGIHSLTYAALQEHVTSAQKTLMSKLGSASDKLSEYAYQSATAALTQLSLEQQAPRFLIFIKMHNNVASVIDYLAALQSNVVALLLDPDTNDAKLEELITAFEPNAIIDRQRIVLRHTEVTAMDNQVAILLPTSGSTGAVKHVAISYKNLHSNSVSICEYLPITASDRAISTLPLFYSYGLSVLNSHLQVGASLVFSTLSIVNRGFWQLMNDVKVTSLAGVPHTYEMLKKLRMTQRDLPYLRYMTQAGGKLEVELITHFAEYAKQQHKQFFVMYGQTEATARMAFISGERLRQKPGSIGRPIPGGKFSLRDNELCYSGPNVMLGYCQSRSELAFFKPITWLSTGDLATVDADGDYRIIGRKKRFIKVFGHRIDLDHIETLLAQQAITSYCCGVDGRLVIAYLTHDQNMGSAEQIKTWVHKVLGVHPSALTLVAVDILPRLANGKKDYQSILNMVLDNPISKPITE